MSSNTSTGQSGAFARPMDSGAATIRGATRSGSIWVLLRAILTHVDSVAAHTAIDVSMIGHLG